MQYRNVALALEVVVGYLLSLSILSPTLAQAEQCQPSSGGKITCASVDYVENSVMLDSLARKKIREPVQRGTLLFPDENLHTLSDSSAELQFNDGSIARSAPETNFSFQPNRNIQLIDGKVLVMVKPGSGGSEVQTAVATVKAPGTAFLVNHRAGRKETLVQVLTDSPVTVTSKKGQTVTLGAGQSVVVTPEKIAPIQKFDLQELLKGDPLARCLGPGQQCVLNTESPKAKETLNAIVQEVCNAIKNQSSSTPSTVSCPQTPEPPPTNHPNPPDGRGSSSFPSLDPSSAVQPWNDPNPPASIGSPSLYDLDPSSALQPGNLTRIAPN